MSLIVSFIPFVSMKYIKIDAERREISTCIFPDLNDKLGTMQAEAAGDGLIEAAVHMDNDDTVFVDEEGLMKDYEFGFIFKGGEPFHGNGIVCGFDPKSGDTVDVKSTALEIALLVEFILIEKKEAA